MSFPKPAFHRKTGRRSRVLFLATLCALVTSSIMRVDAADFYWELPRTLSAVQGRFPAAFKSGERVVALWQEAVKLQDDSGQAWLSASTLNPDGTSSQARFAGPFPFRGSEPPLFSANVSASGTIAVAAAATEYETQVFLSQDGGRKFGTPSVIVSDVPVVVPVIFPRSQGGWYILASRLFTSYVLVGPANDPAGVAGAQSIEDAFSRIAEKSAPFISRGDNSATNAKELEIWQGAKNKAPGPWYTVANAGMAAVLKLADTAGAYTLSESSVFEPLKAQLGLINVYQGNVELLNPFHSIVVTTSQDGVGWSPWTDLIKDTDNLPSNRLLPTMARSGTRDYVIFQSLDSGERPTFQLYEKHSDDSGASWSVAKLITTFKDRDAKDNVLYDNRRPMLERVGKRLFLAWERRQGSGRPQIQFAELDSEGAILPDTANRVSNGAGDCFDPRLMDIEGAPAIVWFDNSKGNNRIWYAQLEGVLWKTRELSFKSSGDSSFGRAVYRSGRLWAFWQKDNADTSRIVSLEPDTTVRPPKISALNFRTGERNRRDSASFTWSTPEDSSGIKGYSWSWSQDPAAKPPLEQALLDNVSTLTRSADADGPWYFSLRTLDYANNWSTPERIEYFRDTKAPGKPRIGKPLTSADGFLASNSFAVSWTAPEPDAYGQDIAGYTWSLTYLGALDRIPARYQANKEPLPPEATIPDGPYNPEASTEYERSLAARIADLNPPPFIKTQDETTSFANIDDGYYVFSIAAIDSVGNIGEAARSFLRADKFVPFTYIGDLVQSVDVLGNNSLRILGRGFNEDGRVTKVVVDQDGKEPWDAEFSLDSAGFSLVSDRLISNISFPDLEKGEYRIGVYHSKRLWYFARSPLTIDSGGTIKFGDYSETYKPVWLNPQARRFSIPIFDVLAVAAFAVAALGLVLSLRSTLSAVQEGAALRTQVYALLEGSLMPNEKRVAAARAIKKRGMGLIGKFSLAISGVVIFVVLLVAIPLGLLMIDNQSRNLASGLEQRAQVLMASLESGGRSYLPSRDTLQLGFLPEQVKAMKGDANYVTLTGYAQGGSNPDVIWATNDPEILKGTAKTAGVAYQKQGETALVDALSAKITEMRESLETQATKAVGELDATIASLLAEAKTLGSTDKDIARTTEIGASIALLTTDVQKRLLTIAQANIGSLPEFNPAKPDRSVENYIFFMPILYRGSDTAYFRGLVRLEVNTKEIEKQRNAALLSLIWTTFGVGLLALGSGILGALMLASIIVKPIKAIVKKVKEISDTYQKEKLDGFQIPVTSKDELSVLAQAIVDMTKGLVKGAKDNIELSTAEQDQRALLPLMQDSDQHRLTIGHVDDSAIEFFGYYKGAKLLSGDYLDFRKLDEKHYAFIKCDVSGKGATAAMIVAIVASVFRHYFEGWTLARNGIKLTELCYHINDVLIPCDFKGKFAAFMVGIVNTASGIVNLSHAGDKFYRIYESGTGKLTTYELGSTLFTGAFTSAEIRERTPYSQSQHVLKAGDIMVLYTDGIDEARRYWRDENFEKVLKKEDPIPGMPPRRDQVVEYKTEDLTESRAATIVEAVMARGMFELKREHNPIPDEVLTFNFSTCSGSLEDIVMALVSIEKIFRMYPDPHTTEFDQVKVDVRVDEFLKRHFEQYRSYCGKQDENPEEREAKKKEPGKAPGLLARFFGGKKRRAQETTAIEAKPERMIQKAPPMYLMYTHMMEDEQYDDITVLTIRRK